MVKQKDYDVDSEVEAATPYALWSDSKAGGSDLCPGDVLETVREDGVPGELQIFKYIGFEPAKWWIAEPKPDRKSNFGGAQSDAAFAADSPSN